MGNVFAAAREGARRGSSTPGDGTPTASLKDTTCGRPDKEKGTWYLFP